MVSDTGSPVLVSRNNCVSPSPGSVPGTWKPLAMPVIAGGAPGWPDFHEGARVQRVMEAIEKSHASRSWTGVPA